MSPVPQYADKEKSSSYINASKTSIYHSGVLSQKVLSNINTMQFLLDSLEEELFRIDDVPSRTIEYRRSDKTIGIIMCQSQNTLFEKAWKHIHDAIDPINQIKTESKITYLLKLFK